MMKLCCHARAAGQATQEVLEAAGLPKGPLPGTLDECGAMTAEELQEARRVMHAGPLSRREIALEKAAAKAGELLDIVTWLCKKCQTVQYGLCTFRQRGWVHVVRCKTCIRERHLYTNGGFLSEHTGFLEAARG